MTAKADRVRTRRRRRAVDHAALRMYRPARFAPALRRYLCSGDILTLMTAPLVYSLRLPFALLDAWVAAIRRSASAPGASRRVRRRAYFAIDRHKLSYLNALESVNCVYCSYANGVIGYVREIAARTEQYLVPDPPRRAACVTRTSATQRFAAYGDAARLSLSGSRRFARRSGSRLTAVSDSHEGRVDRRAARVATRAGAPSSTPPSTASSSSTPRPHRGLQRRGRADVRLRAKPRCSARTSAC